MDKRREVMDREAFSEAVWAIRASMLRTAMSFLRSRADAEDAVQDAVLAAWERLGTLRDPSAFRTWMMVILSNSCRTMLRKKKRIVLSQEVEPQQTQADDAAQQLWEAVLALDEKMRLPIVLHYYEGFSIEEIAVIVRAPKGTVAARMSRARERLKCELTQRGGTNMTNERFEAMLREQAKPLATHGRYEQKLAATLAGLPEKERGSWPVRRAMVAALAAVMALALASGAIAVRLGLFGRLSAGREEEPSYERLALLDEAAMRVGETAALDGGAELTLNHAYCDGNRLYYSYTLSGEGVVLGDGASLEDGTSLTIWDRGEESADGVTYGYQEVELPEAAKPGEALPIVLTVIAENADSTFRYIDVPFAVMPMQRETRTGSAAFAEYRAQAQLSVTDVEIYGEVDVIGQMGWTKLYHNRMDTDTEDYVVDYQLIADGEVLYNQAYTYGEAEGGYGIPVRYDLPAACERLVLRPVRYLSGECEEEEIVLK